MSLKIPKKNIDLLFERFYVLELCSSTLQHCFLADENVNKYRGPLPSQVEGSLQMVSGLEYLHSQNIVHGNIKPENVLISSAQPVLLKLGDFSRLRESLSVWTAPEILTETTDDVRQLGASVAQRRATAQSDTWSLGCVLFFFLQQGRHPFGDKNIIKNASEGNPNLLRGKSSFNFDLLFITWVPFNLFEKKI